MLPTYNNFYFKAGGHALATHKSAEKRARQSLRRAQFNKSRNSSVKTWEKKLRSAIQSKDTKVAQELLKTFATQIDRAAKKNIVHFKAASRKISRLSKQVFQISK